MADTFDILLLQIDSKEWKENREKTKCEFDHMAMVLKFESWPNEVFVLTSLPKQGVVIQPWSDLRKLTSTYSKIAIRHLNWERSDESLNIINEFVDETKCAVFKQNEYRKSKSHFEKAFKFF